MNSDAMSYFELNSAMGVTKHGGGKAATDELAKMCGITKGSRVLVIGCGVGASAVHIAKKYGCNITGIDISEEMVRLSRSRARRERVDAEFLVADAQSLPFKSGTFDAVISESVTVFIPDRSKALKEYFRVLKPGGRAGLNELYWAKTPTKHLEEYISRAMGIRDLPDSGGWENLMRRAGFKAIDARQKRLGTLSQMLSEMAFLTKWDIIEMPVAMLTILLSKRAWKGMIQMMPFPVNLFAYWGHGLYVGIK